MAYTHGHAESVLRSHRARTAANSAAHLLPYLRPEHRLLDVGSGPGTITADIAVLVREVVALEIDDEAAAISRAGLDERGITNTDVVVGTCRRWPCPTTPSTSSTPIRSSNTSATPWPPCGRWPA